MDTVSKKARAGISKRQGKERVRTEHSQKCSGKWQAEAQAMGLSFVILGQNQQLKFRPRALRQREWPEIKQ